MSDRLLQITQILRAWGDGETVARDRLAELVYDELRAIAEGVMRGGRDNTLQPTAIVNEAWMRLESASPGSDWASRKHFYAVAAKAMRHVIADHARRRRAAKRGADATRVTLDAELAQVAGPSLDVVALDEACTRLAQLDARQAEIVELRFFAGLSIEATAEALGLSTATIKDEWRVARAWLRRAIEGARGHDE